MNNDENKKGIIGLIMANKGYFLINVFIILTITFSVLYLFGLVPDSFKTIVGREPVQETTGNRTGELPITIVIPAIGVNAPIYNPATTSADVLDSFLLKGAVRYPGSGFLGGSGNIFIFGHSTRIAIVNNEAYKTFNGLKDLKEGDLIHVFSDKYEYVYKVLRVTIVGADKALVEFNTKNEMLTISTCNRFTSPGDRAVAESIFVAKKAL